MNGKDEVPQYVGVVDTNGLDFFKEFTGANYQCAEIRAVSNPHRHACLFLANFKKGVKPLEAIKHCNCTWEMWGFIRAFATEIKCSPKDVKTLENIKELAETHQALTV